MFLLMPTLWAQDGQERGKRHFSKRFAELEKIKLIEILDLDEETTLKFFARRKQTKNNMEELMKEGEEIYKRMEEVVANKVNEKDYDSLIKDAMMIEKEKMNEKSKFIYSLNDILSKEQVVKLVLFERNFKKDVRDLLIDRGRKKYTKERLKK